MGSSSDSSASSVKRRILSGAKVARSRRIPSSDRAASLQELKAAASRCQTPKQSLPRKNVWHIDVVILTAEKLSD
jgi:hypothetical protein